MNALLNVIKTQKNIALANHGRLLKKSFFGLIILSLAFQPGEFGGIIRQSMTDAYLQVSVFVGITLFIFIGLDSLTKFDISNFLIKTKKIHVPIAAIMGALPGCGGDGPSRRASSISWRSCHPRRSRPACRRC